MMLVAPEKGEVTRRNIKKAVDRTIDKAGRVVDQTIDKAERVVNRNIDRAESELQSIRKKANATTKRVIKNKADQAHELVK